MKKNLIIGFSMLISTLAIAQNDTVNETVSEYKSASGDKTLELQFSPFGDNPIDINGIRMRWFKSNNNAFRLNAFLSVSNDTEITQQEDSNNNLKELRDKAFAFTISLRPGMERHFKGTDRLSPYYGWESELTYRTTSFKVESQFANDVKYTKTINQEGYLRLGANLIAGFDYYVAKKLYLGAELGFGASWTKLLSVKTKSDIDGFTEPDPAKRGSSFDVGPNVNAQIRLGYAF